MQEVELKAKIVAAITSDGHLQLDNRRGVISFYSKHLKEVNSFNKTFTTLFGVGGKVHHDESGGNLRYKLYIPNKKSAIDLATLGTPIGNKTKINFSIPSWIRDGSSKIKSIYLRMLFDCEGSIYLQDDGRWRLKFKMAKDESLIDNGIDFMKEVKELLEEFDVETSNVLINEGNIRKDGSKSLFMIMEIKGCSFINFLKYVGFDNSLKRMKLEKAINSMGRSQELLL